MAVVAGGSGSAVIALSQTCTRVPEPAREEHCRHQVGPPCSCVPPRAGAAAGGWAVLSCGLSRAPAPFSRPRASCSARMGLQQSRQSCALPKPAAEPPAPPPERYDGLIPRSLTARQACNARRVRRLIRAGRLAPCFEQDLPGAEGEVRVPAPRSCGLPAPIAARCCTLAPAAAGAPAARDHPPSVKVGGPPAFRLAGMPSLYGALPPPEQHGLLPPRHL